MDDVKQPWTQGPWRWDVRPKNHEYTLEGRDGDVMRFARWGMGGAAPVFRRDGLMVRGDEFAVVIPGREHHQSWARTVDHPDARLIAQAPAMAEALAAVVMRWDHRTVLDSPGTIRCGEPSDPPDVAKARAVLDAAGWRWS